MKNKLLDLLDYFPKPIKKWLVKTCKISVRNWHMFKTWYLYSRHYSAPIKPLKIYNINPSRIEFYHGYNIGKHKHSTAIINGDWDQNVVLFSENLVHKSFKMHFEKGEAWENTPIYGKKDKKSQRAPEYYDELFETIRTKGYSTQEELLAEYSIVDLRENEMNLELGHIYRPEFMEVVVDISRDGDMICRSGQHRVSIAKILNLNEIPIAIRIRHEDWQLKRDKVWRGLDTKDIPLDHPDIPRTNE